MEKGQTWLTLKWAMIYNRGVWFYNLEDKIFSLPFWILNHNFFVLLYLGCSCRTGVCILSSTESTNSTNHTSNQQARNFTSVANSMFENLEGNFKTKQKNMYKMIQSSVSEQKRKFCISEIDGWVEAFLKEGSCSFHQLSTWEFVPWLQCIPLPNDLCRTATVWVV